MTLIKMAWRNLWRNPRRTLITLFSMTFGLTMMIVGYALSDGMLNQMVHYATLLGTGHGDSFVNGTIGSASPRVFATALVSSGQQSAGGKLWGIDPDLESSVTELHKHLETGTWLATGASGSVVLGRNLARTLSVGPGDEIVVLTQAADGSRPDPAIAYTGGYLSTGGCYHALRAIVNRVSNAILKNISVCPPSKRFVIV